MTKKVATNVIAIQPPNCKRLQSHHSCQYYDISHENIKVPPAVDDPPIQLHGQPLPQHGQADDQVAVKCHGVDV